jgi:hypothetical protein
METRRDRAERNHQTVPRSGGKIKIEGEKPTLIGANKLSNNIVKLQCKSPENANKLRVNGVEWNLANEGLTTRKVKYGIVVHGNPDHKRLLRFHKRQVRPRSHNSIVIFTHDRDVANECIRRGVYISITSGNTRNDTHRSTSGNPRNDTHCSTKSLSASNATNTNTELCNAGNNKDAGNAAMKVIPQMMYKQRVDMRLIWR